MAVSDMEHGDINQGNPLAKFVDDVYETGLRLHQEDKDSLKYKGVVWKN